MQRISFSFDLSKWYNFNISIINDQVSADQNQSLSDFKMMITFLGVISEMVITANISSMFMFFQILELPIAILCLQILDTSITYPPIYIRKKTALNYIM